MSEIKAIGAFDKEKGTLTIVLDLAGHSPIEHELLAAAFDEKSEVEAVVDRHPETRRVLRGFHMEPTHDGDELSATITIYDPSLWDRAVRAETNRQRKADGKPTLEEEEAQAVMEKAAAEDAAKRADEAKEKAAEDAQAKQDADDARIAKIAAKVVAESAKS